MTPWSIAHQGPLLMEFSGQESQSGLPYPGPGDLPDPGIEPGSPVLPADSLPFEPPGKAIVHKTQLEKQCNCQILSFSKY